MSRPTDRALRPSVDGLEGRFMLSAGIQRPAVHAQPRATESLSFNTPWIASQQWASATVTLTRRPLSEYNSSGSVISQGRLDDALVVHVTSGDWTPNTDSNGLPLPPGIHAVGFGSTPAPDPGGPPTTTNVVSPAIPNVHFVPVDETVTFLPGESSKTITVPIIPGAENPGRVRLNLEAVPTGGFTPPTSTSLVIDARPDAMTPTIVDSRLVVDGRKATGIAIQFNTPMDVASVTDPNAYKVKDDSHQAKTSALDVLKYALFNTYTYYSKPVKIQSAAWDASTNTVTLIPKGPLMRSGRYGIESRIAPRPKGSTGTYFSQVAVPLRDQAGNYLNDNGQPGGLPGGFGGLSVGRRLKAPLAS